MQKQYYQHIDKLLASEVDIAIRGRAKEILTQLNLNTGDKVLDAGCGWGYYLQLIEQLPAKGYQLIGVDLDRKSVLSAKRKLKHKTTNVRVADLYKLPFPNNTFDKIIMSEVAEHLPDDLPVFKELHRVLKPGGFILVTVPNHNYPFFWDPLNWTLEHLFGTHIKSGFWAGIWTNHERLYYPDEIVSVVKNAGFNIDMLSSLTLFCLPFNKNLLYGGKLPPRLSQKFIQQTKQKNKHILIELLLFIVRLNDKLNQIFKSERVGVSVFVKASKKK